MPLAQPAQEAPDRVLVQAERTGRHRHSLPVQPEVGIRLHPGWSALLERSFHGRDGAVFGVTASFGVAQLQPGEGERQLFARADRALYEAKKLGKNRVETATGIRSF